MPPPLSGSTIRMICPNTSCINKSVVYRKYDPDKIQTCNACKSVLIKTYNKLKLKQDYKAKLELKQLGNFKSQ